MSGGLSIPEEALLRDRQTGLPNRRAFLAALRERVPGGRGALVMLDLDGFQQHTRGLSRKRVERLLSEVADRLRSAAGPGGLLFRYAADAFCLILPEADRDRGVAAAEALREALARAPLDLGEAGETRVRVAVTASAAVAAYPLDGVSPAVLIETAETALLVAKHQGRDRVAVAGRLDPAVLAQIGVFRGIPCPVLVGRAAEQSKLRQLASDVRAVGPSFAVLGGPPGIGKTRLLRELCLWARAERFVVFRGTCQESRAALPYAALAEAIENLTAADRPLVVEALGRLDPASRTALSVVLRNFPLEGVTGGIRLDEYGRAVFPAFRKILESLAMAGPLLIALDEIEYADAASFEVLREAAQGGLPFLLAATTGLAPEDLERCPAGAFLRERGAAVHWILLEPLSPEDMGRVLRAILPEADIAAGSGDLLVQTCRGNPLFLEETIRALLQKGRVRLQEGRWMIPPLGPDDLPASLEAAIRAVTETLPPRAQSVLTGAAVIGAEIDPDLLQEVLGQEEMEMLDLIDEARRARLLVSAETGQELLSFPAAHARRIRLEALDAARRKELHGRVGVVQEARHGGDVSHLAGELAYHYGQAGNEARALHFEAVARRRAEMIEPPRRGGLRRARIPAVREPLSPAARDHVLSMMRHFSGVLRVGRLYPQWSQVSASFLGQLREAFRLMLSSCGAGVTVSALPSGPQINGVDSDSPAAAEFAALMDDRLIESLTILKTFDPGRLEVLVRAFGDPFDRVRAAPDHWERFLERERLEGVDLVQKAYQARDREGKGAVVQGEEPVPPEHLPALREALRALKAAADNLRLYPPGHTLVEETSREAVRRMEEFLERVPALTLGTAEGELVVNGQPADRKFFGDAGAFFVREIDQRGLGSISIGRGVAQDEILMLVSFLSIPRGEPEKAETLVGRFTRILFGSRRYERAAEGVPEVRLAPPPKPIRSELRARALLDLPYPEFLSYEVDEQFPILVEALAYGAGRPVAEELVDRLASHFHDEDIDHRRQAFQLLARSIAFASPTTRKVHITRSAPPLTKRLREDTVVEAFRAASDILPFWIPAAATVGCLRELAEVACGALRPRADAPGTPPEIAASAEAALQLIPDSTAYPLLLAAARRAHEWERRPAVQVLVAVRGPSLGQLLELVAEEPDLFIRRAVMADLAPAAAEAGSELARLLSAPLPADRLVRLLEVMEPLLSPGVLNRFADLVEKGPPALRREILNAAASWPPAAAVPLVRRLLSSPLPELRDLGIETAARMRLEPLAPEIGRLLEKAEEEPLLRRCCGYFAAVVHPAAVPALARIARRRPRLFGIVKGLSAETRAAAVRALERQGTPPAQEAAGSARSDPRVSRLLGG